VFCSTIIPTVGRTSLQRAVSSVLQQQVEDGEFEVIVVNDSGAPLPKAAWQGAARLRVIDTGGHRERSVARNTGAALARGRYLHFLDDDDWLLPGALQVLFALAKQETADWHYGGTRLLDGEGTPLVTLRHQLAGNGFLAAMAGEWIPLQASLIEAAAFFRAGGFNSLLAGPEDVDLLRRITLSGELAETAAMVACVQWRTAGSTTDYEAHVDASRWAREQIMDAAGVFSRMRSTADTAFWHGRMARIYLTSMVWNFRNRRALVATSRALVGLFVVIRSGPRALLSPGFWQSLLNPYQSNAF
jgi:glycosyltransferase involved in cell wall biosynthesis